MPVGIVIVAQLEDQLGECFLLPGGVPKAGISDGSDVYLGVQIPHHHLLPPTHHELHIVFYVLVQPLYVLHSVDMVEIGPEQPVEVVLVHALQVLRNVRKADQLLKRVKVDCLLQDEGETLVVLVASLSQYFEDGSQQLMNEQRYFSMCFEEQFAVDIVDQSIC